MNAAKNQMKSEFTNSSEMKSKSVSPTASATASASATAIPSGSLNVHHRLLSIVEDSTGFLKNVIDAFHNIDADADADADADVIQAKDREDDDKDDDIDIDNPLDMKRQKRKRHDYHHQHQSWPIVANERCGSWYAYPYTHMNRNRNAQKLYSQEDNQRVKRKANLNNSTGTGTSTSTSTSTHFKSTDGHIHIYNFSLRRLNLDFLKTVSMASMPSSSISHTISGIGGGGGGGGGGVLIIDASKYKIQPDSFSSTLPLWCAVLNHVTLYYRDKIGKNWKEKVEQKRNKNRLIQKKMNGSEHAQGDVIDRECYHGISENGKDKDKDDEWWDTTLFTPDCISSLQHEEMKQILPDRVESVISSKVILDPMAFLTMMHKPLRCFWIENSNSHEDNENDGRDNDDGDGHQKAIRKLCGDIAEAQLKYMCIVCISCSNPTSGSPNTVGASSDGNNSNFDESSSNADEYSYVSGAGDDEESWARGLTASLFWGHKDEILMPSVATSASTSHTNVIATIDKLVAEAEVGNEEWLRSQIQLQTNTQIQTQVESRPYTSCTQERQPLPFTSYFNTIGDTGISIGTRRSGRPPECWNYFDAIVNVTTMEYPGMGQVPDDKALPEGKYYLQLPVKEGKRDKTELEHWMAVAMLFIGVSLYDKRRILIHCAQGQDRSVAVAMAAICLFFPSLVSVAGAVAETDRDTNASGDGERLDLNNSQFFNYASIAGFISHQGYVNPVKGNSEQLDEKETDKKICYRSSRLQEKIVKSFMGKDGRDMLFEFIRNLNMKLHSQPDAKKPKTYANKETLRRALLFIQQDRPKANPTRSTMQKLNRFFMSGFFEPP